MRTAAMQRLQYRLAVTLMILLVLTTLFGHVLIPQPITPDRNDTYRWETVDGVRTMVTAPFPPDSQNWLGTDHRGYDVLSMILHGAKYTLGFSLAVTFCRYLIALPVGLLAGVTGRGRSLLATLQMIVSSVPALLIVFPALYGLYLAYGMSEGLSPDDPKVFQFMVLLFALLVLIGLFQPAHQFSERARYYADKLFVTVSRTIGASDWRIAFRHLMPHLRPEVLFAFLADFVQVLFLVGQLAVLSIFLGGCEVFVIDADDPSSAVVLTQSGEWGALIAYGAKTFRTAPWIIAASGGSLTVSILILTFFSKQWQNRLARPAIYRSRPWRANKPALAAVTAAVVACTALLLVLPSRTEMAATGLATDEQLRKQEEIRSDLTRTAAQVVAATLNDRLSEAIAYTMSGPQEIKVDRPALVLDRWSKAFVSGRYAFVDIGEVRVSDLSFDRSTFYEVDVRVQSQSGGEETWRLLMTPRMRNFGSRVIGVLDGPK